MSPSNIQPWGTRPTPLLPKTLVEELGHVAAPSALRETLGLQATLEALNGQLWDRLESVSEDCLREIVDIVRPRLSSLKHLPVGSGQPLSKSLVQNLPFSIRTRNAVFQHVEKFTYRQLTFEEVLLVPSVGVRSAIEFACVVEAAIDRPAEGVRPTVSPEQPAPRAMSIPGEIKSAFQVLAAYAAGERNLETSG